MDTTTRDWLWLSSYAQRGDEQAFSQLVAAHLDLVYAAAVRRVKDPQLAEDVTQAVFILLARKAGSFRSDTLVPLWLLRATHFTSLNALKRENRRRQHERKAAEMACRNLVPDPRRRQLADALDEAMDRLSRSDREAIVLRYFQQCSLAETGRSLGISEAAAQMRVSRALEKLRDFLRRRGVAMRSGELGAMVTTVAFLKPTPEFAQSVAGAALQAIQGIMAPSVAELVQAAARALAIEKARFIALVLSLVLAIGVGTFLLGQYALPALWRTWHQGIPSEPAAGWMDWRTDTGLPPPSWPKRG